MKPKSLLLLALAGGCGLVASIGISQVMDKNAQGGVALETTPIYVAVHNINLGDPIDSSMVTLMEWPKDRIPPGAITQLENLAGRRPRANIIQGEPVLDAKLLAQGEHADPISQLPEGYRLSTISVNAEKSAAGLLSPGDRVDIQLFVNRNDRAGIERPTTKVILQNIRVFAVEQAVQRSADGGEARTIPKTVSLMVTPKQASKIDLAQNLGTLSLIPRSPNDEVSTAAVEITADDLFAEDGSKNTREKEQNRDAAEDGSEKSSFLGGLVQMMREAAENQPPFQMELVLADEVTVLEFDRASGKPVREDGGAGGDNGLYGPAAPGVPEPTPAAEATPADFPIDFGEDG
ncbi:MAG: Flp pilus assembly protein CpaB [Planctomycetota bacterium]